MKNKSRHSLAIIYLILSCFLSFRLSTLPVNIITTIIFFRRLPPAAASFFFRRLLSTRCRGSRPSGTVQI
jgi:hypothetical protein